jgi:hypothetical protein
MSYKKRFTNQSGALSTISGAATGNWNSGSNPAGANMGSTDFSFRNYGSRLSEVYTGHPNRVERYNQYEMMDVDPEINACLDILSEFSTQTNEHNGTPFDIKFNDDPTQTEVELVSKQLKQWCKLNEFDTRIFKLFRNTMKYGDQVFIRDPETFKLFWVDMIKVSKVIVNESEGKEPEQYVVKDININLQNLTVAPKTTTDLGMNPSTGFGGTGGGIGGGGGYTVPQAASVAGSRFSVGIQESAIDAKHIVHLSLTEGLDRYWPFGQSILENVFKVYKQKELLEDAILIYRIQRAPERRMFKIDVGNMPSHMAMAFVNRIKDEIHQRRIPSPAGGASLVDSTYNPLSMNEDYFFPVNSEGRGSTVEMLQGGNNLGEIDDLKYFNNRLARGLRIPSSYLPTGPEDQQTPLSDGRVGTAMIQEFRFNQYCERLQGYIARKLNEEFKLFMRWRGFNIDASLFDIKFNAPQNFASYRQAELDTARVTTFQTMSQLPYMSTRFTMKRFLGLSEEEIKENEKLWREERTEPEADEAKGSDLRSIGISAGDIEGDLETADGLDAAAAEGGDAGMGPESVPPVGGDMGMGAPAGGMPPPPAI